jgi:predicted AlkP superfamily pyrophosphatase or phosphodiesterase
MKAIVISIDGFAGFYWDDPLARLPTLRRLAEQGVVASHMEAVFPSTTWPTHVSMLTGVSPARHGVVGNYILNRDSGRAEDLTGDPIYDAPRLLRAPTVYDLAHAAGRRTAAIDWPATRGSPSLDWCLPFFKNQAVFEKETAAAVWEELGKLGFPRERQGEWAQLPLRFLKDAMVADLAIHVARHHRPDLLLVHFLCTDSLQHLYGPRSPEAYWAIEYVDGLIGRFLSTLPAGELEERTALFIVSDHGFLAVDREVRPNVRLRQLGLLRVDAEGRAGGESEARFVTNHGAGYLYLLGADRGPGADRQARARELAAELGALDGVARVWTAREYVGLGLPTPAENALVGDLVVEAQPGWSFGDEARGDDLTGPPRYRGNHGYLPSHADNHAFFLAAGPGLGRGRRLVKLRSRDVAPTLAQVLGIAMPDVEGHVLEGVTSAS